MDTAITSPARYSRGAIVLHLLIAVLIDSLKAWEAALSRVVHAGFYFLLLATPNRLDDVIRRFKRGRCFADRAAFRRGAEAPDD